MGSPRALGYAQRDLPNLDRAVSRCRQTRVAVQAGGSLGLYPKRLAQTFTTVYTFEPAVELFPLLYQNAPEPNILKYQAALGHLRCTVGTSCQRRDGRTDSHEGIAHVSGEGPVPVLMLDDFGLSVCDFLQLDVEGWELYACTGAQKTILRCRPVLMLEINKSLAFMGLTAHDVRSYVTEVLRYRQVDRLASDDVFVPSEWGSS